MNQLIIQEYLRNQRDCWNCGKKAPKGKKCPHCKALPERPRVYALPLEASEQPQGEK